MTLRGPSRSLSSSSKTVFAPLFVALAAALSGCAGQTPENEALDENGVEVRRGASVSQALHHDESGPLRLMPVAPRSEKFIEHEVKKLPRTFNTSLASDPVHQRRAARMLVPTASRSFDGVGQGFSGPSGSFTVQSAPPDTNGDVGPNHYVQTVNSDFAIFNKSGTALYGPVTINTLFSGFGGGCQTNNDGDPVVLYDPIADRWIISQFSVTGADGTSLKPFLQCVAVSQTADPTGAYYRYAFSYTGFNDYPKMGVWPDAYYTSFNMFNAAGTSFLGGKVCAYDRAKMLAGQPATQQCFDAGASFGGLLPADLDGARQPPLGSPNYVLALGSAANTLAFWKFKVNWTTPSSSTFSGPTTLSVASFAEACAGGTCIPQSGTTQQLDSLSDRLMFRLAYRNFGDHEALVVNHSVTAGSATGVRWYEIRLASQVPSIFQQGTYAPDSAFRWMGSIAMDQSGNMGLGFSTSSGTLHPEIRYTGRLVGDAAGTMGQGEGTFVAGAGSQGTTLSRWGDYSMMGVDPVDDCTFWFTSEYIPANGTFNWRTRIGSFRFPGCGAAATNDFSISASPSTLSLAAGGSGSSTISTAVVSGTAQTVNLSVTGVPAGASASISPTAVTAGGSATLSVSAGTAAAGTYTLTVTGAATSATHSTSVSLTIQPATGGDTPLSNGVAVSNLSGAAGSQKFFVITVPAGQPSLTVATSGGTGDADLYVRLGSHPSTTVFDCKSDGSTTTESCTINSPAAGSYYILVQGYTAYSGVTIKATYGDPPLTNGVPVTGISGATGSNQYWKLTVPAGQARAVFSISGGTGDADLYVRRGARPTTTTYDCRPYLTGNNETCTITSPVAGDYYVMINGYAAYSGVTLTGSYP